MAADRLVMESRRTRADAPWTPFLSVERADNGWIAVRETTRAGALVRDWRYVVFGRLDAEWSAQGWRIATDGGASTVGPQQLKRVLRRNGQLLRGCFGRPIDDYISAILNAQRRPVV